MQILSPAAVLSIFWTLAIVGPMSDEGAKTPLSRASILTDPTRKTSAYKESFDMKRAIYSLLTACLLIGLTGCVTRHGRRPLECMGGSCAQAPENCLSCDQQCREDPGTVGYFNPRGGRGFRGRDCRGDCCEDYVNPGPPSGTIAYPYYTIRGPRDFLANNPPSIGP